MSNKFIASYACCISSSCDSADESSGVSLLQNICSAGMVSTTTVSCSGSVVVSSAVSSAWTSTAVVSSTMADASVSTESITSSTRSTEQVTSATSTSSPQSTKTEQAILVSSTLQPASTPLASSNDIQSSTNSHSAGISVRAKAGIAASLVGAVLIAVILLCLFWRRRWAKPAVFGEEQIDDKSPEEPELAIGELATGAHICTHELGELEASPSQDNRDAISRPGIHELA